jgi:hypothetical protein
VLLLKGRGEKAREETGLVSSGDFFLLRADKAAAIVAALSL